MDARIPLGFRAEQPEIYTPLDAQRKRLTLQSLAGQNRAADLRAQEDEQKLRMMKEDQQDEGIIQQKFHEFDGDHDKMRAAIAPKVRMRNLQKWDADHLKAQQAALAMTNENRLATKLSNDLVSGEVAGLYGLPYEQRVAELPNALERLKKNGIDVEPYRAFDPTDANLRQAAARSQYTGKLLSFADQQYEEEQKKVARDKAKDLEKQAQQKTDRERKQAKLEDAARAHLGVTSGQHHVEWLKNLDPEIAPLYKDLTDYTTETRRAIQQMGMTSDQRARDDDRSAAEADRNRQRDMDRDLRRDIAEQNAAMRGVYLEILRNKGAGGRRLTPGQMGVELRNIEGLETGTGTKDKPGLNTLRLRFGQQLKSGKNEKGEFFKDPKTGKITDQAEHDRIQSELQAATDNLQHAQFRKANLYNIPTPDPQDIGAAEEGAEIPTAEGAIWTKRGGVAFFTRMEGQQPAGAPATPPAARRAPATAPSSAPAPATPAAAPPKAAAPAAQKMTEADARKKAIAAQKDPEWYVNELRKRNLLQ